MRTVATVAVVVIGLLFPACGNNGPTAPSNTSPSAPSNTSPTPPSSSPLSALTIASMSFSEAGQDASGHWRYKGTVGLQTGGGALTVTKIQVQVLDGPTVLATESSLPMVSIPANSSTDEAFDLATATYVQPFALTVSATIEFRDASGNTGTVNGSFSGNWDY